MVFIESLVKFILPRKLSPHPRRLLDYDLEKDLINLNLFDFKLPLIKKVTSRKLINILFDFICWLHAVKVCWFYWIDIPTAKRYGDFSLFYGDARYYGLAYGVIGFVYINVAYNISHFDRSPRKVYLWLNNYNQPYSEDHFFISRQNRSQLRLIKKRITSTYMFLWICTQFIIIPSAVVIFLAPIFMVERSEDLIINIPSSFHSCYTGFFAFNLVRVSVFLGISYGFIMHFSLELNLKYLRKLHHKKSINYSSIQLFFRHYLALYNEAYESNRFMSKLSGILYCGTFLESLVCMYVGFIAPSPVLTRILFLGFFNIHVTLNIIFMSLAFIYPQRLEQLIRNTSYKLSTRSVISPEAKMKLDEALLMMESYPPGWRCFHFFRFSSSSLLLTLIELGAHMLLIVMSVPRVSG